MNLQDSINEVKNENPLWKSNPKIIGRAGEKYCCKNMNCIKCNGFNWLECKTNKKSIDQICKLCKKKYQIKCKNITEKKYTKIIKNKVFKTLGAEYKTTLDSIKENIDYIIILYNKKDYMIHGIIHIKSINITSDNIIPRKPLSKNAKRAGWQGCNLHFTKFNCIEQKHTKND